MSKTAHVCMLKVDTCKQLSRPDSAFCARVVLFHDAADLLTCCFWGMQHPASMVDANSMPCGERPTNLRACGKERMLVQGSADGRLIYFVYQANNSYKHFLFHVAYACDLSNGKWNAMRFRRLSPPFMPGNQGQGRAGDAPRREVSSWHGVSPQAAKES